MKFRIPWVALLALFLGIGGILLTAPAGHAADPLTLEDVLRLHAAGISDDIIASEILVTETVFVLSPEDLLRLKDAGLSDELIHFMVETALSDEDVTTDTPAEDDGVAPGDEVDAQGGWINVIEEEPATTYFVTLDYDYPVWWYDLYWSDYWYYDWHYYPYNCSYSFVWGAWYPTWFSYRYCYLPPYWGYRHHWWGRRGYHWTYADCHSYYPYGGAYTADVRHTTYPHSRTKYKTGSSSGKLLYADAGLKVKDVGRLTRVDAKVPTRPIKDRILVADGRNPGRPGGDRIRRPVKTTGVPDRLSSGLGRPLEGKRTSVSSVDTRPTLPRTRRPALDRPSTPVRTIDRTRSTGQGTDRPVDKPRSLDRTRTERGTDRTVTNPPRVTTPRPAPSKPAPSKPSPKSAPVKTKPPRAKPEVQPAPESPPTPRSEPPRAAPAPSAPRPSPSTPPPTKAPVKERKSGSKQRGRSR